jgi:glutamate 5-kinase
LPIGAIDIVGDFEKDDIVRIIDPNGLLLGIGKVQYDSGKAREILGKKNQKPLVHCDYLYLE